MHRNTNRNIVLLQGSCKIDHRHFTVVIELFVFKFLWFQRNAFLLRRFRNTNSEMSAPIEILITMRLAKLPI